MYEKGKKDIIDVLYELNNEIVNNPLLEFLIIIKMIMTKCKNYKRRLEKIKQMGIPQQHWERKLLIKKIIMLLESSKDYIYSSKKYLLRLGIKDDKFFSIFENKGLDKLYEFVEDLKKNDSDIDDNKLEIILDFMMKILDKFKT